MIKLYVKGHSAVTPLTEIIHAFTGEKVEVTDCAENADVVSIFDGETITTDAFGICNENAVMPSKIRNEKQRIGDAAKLGVYLIASEKIGTDLPWGTITGIRPQKLVEQFYEAGEADEFKKRFRVSDKKIKLSLMAAESQKSIKSDTDGVCVYIGIPFCPSRCLYCSFVSLPMEKQKSLIVPYVDCLVREIEYTAQLIKNSGKTVKALYIGGGTPTSLNEELFDKVVTAAGTHFAGVKEFTVEAGRADTITESKLKSALDAGMTRVCINPQTLNNDVLKAIGRNHSAEDFESAFYMARSLGINHINTDLIAGLPGETPEMFGKSLDRLLELEPDGVTVHTMCVKRAADLKTADYKTFDAVEMVDYASERLTENGYLPYYLYRQKDTLGCLENTGYAKPGKESYYNVFMMDDLGTVIGIGAGSVTKIKTEGENNFRRIYNFKNPTEYISMFDEVLKRKDDYDL